MHVVVDTSPVCLLHGRVSALQECATDRDGIGQGHSVTGRTSAFGTLGLDREPFHTDPGNVHYLVEVFNRVDGGKGALNSRPRPVEVTLPGGQLSLPDRHIAIKELAGAGECDKVVQAFGGNRSPTGHLHCEPFGGQLLCRQGHHPLRNGPSQPLTLVPGTNAVANHTLRAAHPDPEPGPAEAGSLGQRSAVVAGGTGGCQIPLLVLQPGEIL